MKLDLISYLASSTPALFFPRLVESLEAAYFDAYSHAKTFDEPERNRVLGQLRHYRQNFALRQAATDSALMAVAPHTDPKGERYSVVASEGIRYGRIGVPFNNSCPRVSKHRKTIAALNSRLEPINLDLFSPASPRPTEGLGCLVVTVNPSRAAEQSVPAAIMIGVPFSNLKGWHLFEPIEEVMAAANPAVEITVPDLAWVKLKKQLSDSES